MREPLKQLLQGKYILCACEGHAEQAIIDLLLDNDFLCFGRQAMIGGECTQIRTGEQLAKQYLGMEMERELAILRILDREKERLVLPKAYQLRDDINIFNVVTKPEIEILHIIDAGLYENFKAQGHGVKASSYCKERLGHDRRHRTVKTREFVIQRYQGYPERLVEAIRKYRYLANPSGYCLADLLM